MAQKPKYFKTRNTLKDKVGDGGLSDHVLSRSQEFLENNTIDFAPYAVTYIAQLIGVRYSIAAGKTPIEPGIEQALTIIMQLKANGSMFHYQLISMLSDVVQRFLERVKNPQMDVLDIIEVYVKILNIIFNKKLKGTGGKEGYALTIELENACKRYNEKYEIHE